MKDLESTEKLRVEQEARAVKLEIKRDKESKAVADRIKSEVEIAGEEAQRLVIEMQKQLEDKKK